MSDAMINPPDLSTVLKELKDEIFATINCIQIGKIESINTAEQTAEISIQVKRRKNNTEIISFPLLVDCPIFILQGGGAYIDMPIIKGDYCLVLFNDRNIDNWWSTANVKEPATLRKHSLSDGIALVGINPKTAVKDIDGQVVRILGTSGAGAEEFAARQNDEIQSTSTEDLTFWTWVTAVGTALGITPPSSLTGKITGGSTEVKIG